MHQIYSREHPCRRWISIKLQSNFIEIILWHGCSPVNLLHIFRITFSKNTPGQLLLVIERTLQLQSCELYINKYMIVLTQITNTEVFAFIAVLFFKLFTRLQTEKAFLQTEKAQKELKSRLLFKKTAVFTGKLLQNQKQLECKILMVLLKHVSDHLSMLFQFA